MFNTKVPDASNIEYLTVTNWYHTLSNNTKKDGSCPAFHLHHSNPPVLGFVHRVFQLIMEKRLRNKSTPGLEQSIRTISSSLWMAPTIFVVKKSDDVRICVNYQEFNKEPRKMHTHFSYPMIVLLALLFGSTIFSALYHQSGYWQLLVIPKIVRKQCFAQDWKWDYFSSATQKVQVI